MNSLIKTFTRSNYGTPRVYLVSESPADTLRNEAITRLTGRATLSDRDIACLHDLGFAFQQVIDPALAARAKHGCTVLPCDPCNRKDHGPTLTQRIHSL